MLTAEVAVELVGATLVGIAAGFLSVAPTVVRLRRRLVAVDAAGERWHRRHGITRQELDELCEEIAELGYVIHDGQRRWGFSLARWPGVAAIIGRSTPEAAGRFLVEWAPGIAGLRDGGRATDRVA